MSNAKGTTTALWSTSGAAGLRYSSCSRLMGGAALLILVPFTPMLGESPPAEDDRHGLFPLVEQQARRLAERSFQASPELPNELRTLNYDSYRLIAFEHEKALWKRTASPFWLEFFHRGYLFSEKVAINLVEDGRPAPFPFDRRLFQYRGKLADISVPADVGYAGFRILSKFESSPHFLEMASFLGASYFRAIGEGQVYGTSARGLATDIGLPKAEEFPAFREFWIGRPASDARRLTIWALLDSPAVAGAYGFVLHPGKATVWDVKARLFFRRQPDKIGVAPLTSMWAWGDGKPGPAADRRPKVHDSDGLLVRTKSGEWIWRPLAQQHYPSLSRFDFAGIRGFGLLQRDRRPEHYLDNEAKYHLRPSVWIEPGKGWSEGAVALLELPAEHEGIDNIAAWWVPKRPLQSGGPVDLDYRVSFKSGEPEEHKQARAVATRVLRRNEKSVRLEVDFAGGGLGQAAADAVTPEVHADRGVVKEVKCKKSPDGSWRVGYYVEPAGDAPVELRALLKHNGHVVTETWRYLCPSSDKQSLR